GASTPPRPSGKSLPRGTRRIPGGSTGTVLDRGLEGRSVLIVEDDFDVRDALSQLLEFEGYLVAGAANGQEAIDHLRSTPPPTAPADGVPAGLDDADHGRLSVPLRADAGSTAGIDTRDRHLRGLQRRREGCAHGCGGIPPQADRGRRTAPHARALLRRLTRPA